MSRAKMHPDEILTDVPLVRRRFRAELDVDDAAWSRGRGWALYQAVTGLAYYWDTNPEMVRQTAHALAQILADDFPS
ncbi:hypothetical protein [Streptosporangium sp. NPDC049046]|uniref:hypothetical protein n=1 Tax=Streptosporangium sp. NPDC049046 TaxID=3155031 RepID=UPI00343F4674